MVLAPTRHPRNGFPANWKTARGYLVYLSCIWIRLNALYLNFNPRRQFCIFSFVSLITQQHVLHNYVNSVYMN